MVINIYQVSRACKKMEQVNEHKQMQPSCVFPFFSCRRTKAKVWQEVELHFQHCIYIAIQTTQAHSPYKAQIFVSAQWTERPLEAKQRDNTCRFRLLQAACSFNQTGQCLLVAANVLHFYDWRGKKTKQKKQTTPPTHFITRQASESKLTMKALSQLVNRLLSSGTESPTSVIDPIVYTTSHVCTCVIQAMFVRVRDIY